MTTVINTQPQRAVVIGGSLGSWLWARTFASGKPKVAKPPAPT